MALDLCHRSAGVNRVGITQWKLAKTPLVKLYSPCYRQEDPLIAAFLVVPLYLSSFGNFSVHSFSLYCKPLKNRTIMFHKTQQWGRLLSMSVAMIKFSRQKLVAGWFSIFVRTYEWKSAVLFRLKAINSGYFWDRATIRLRFLCWEAEGAIYVATSSPFGVIRSTQKITPRHGKRETCRLPPPPPPPPPPPDTHGRARTHHCPGRMLPNPNQSSQLPENMTWPFRFTEHQLWVGLACFPFQRTLCPSRPLRHPRGPKPSTNNYSRWSLHSTRQSQKSLTLILTRT